MLICHPVFLPLHKRRLAQLYGLLGHGYLGLGNPKEGAHFFKHAIHLLDEMPENVSQVVIEDVVARGFMKKLKEASKNEYETLIIDLNSLKNHNLQNLNVN